MYHLHYLPAYNAFRADGRLMAWFNGGMELQIWNIETGLTEEQHIYDMKGQFCHLLVNLAALQESRGGDVAYVIDQANSVLRLMDSVTLEAIEDNIPVGDMPTAVAISPDLTKIYMVNGSSANISVLEF